ncbi:MAG TPA: hypothetical protein VFU23_03875 [Gemmatimonadales bacterium]|nr:hypothetical protein [Gemmatimonadales bacterium]
MSTVRQGAPGATRVCPHCRTTILESAAVCPSCKHHLRSNASGSVAPEREVPSFTALKVQGTIRHPEAGEPWEYSVVISIRNERGEEVSRQVVGVGALRPADTRTFSLSVEMFTPADAKTPASVRPRA